MHTSVYIWTVLRALAVNSCIGHSILDSFASLRQWWNTVLFYIEIIRINFTGNQNLIENQSIIKIIKTTEK